jgi:hypothetical protein
MSLLCREDHGRNLSVRKPGGVCRSADRPHLTELSLPDEALVIDRATADVANHDAVLLAAIAAGDVLLVHDVFADPRAVNDFAVKLRVFVENACEASAEGCMASRHESASRVLDDAVG